MQNAAQITIEDYKRAFLTLAREGSIKEKQGVMLREHYRAPDHVITASQLAEVVSYADHRGVNLWYGKLGQMVAEKVGYAPPKGYTFLSTLVTFDREATPYPMRLRLNVVEALKEIGWV